MTLANITKSVKNFTAALLRSGEQVSFSSWDNEKTYHLNLLLVLSALGAIVYAIVNTWLGEPSLSYFGGAVLAFNLFLFLLQANNFQYLARTITCLGYPLLFLALILLNEGLVRGEYAFFLMTLISVLFFRKLWRQIAMIAYVFFIFLTSQIILLYQFDATQGWTAIINNSTLFLAISFGLVLVTNSFIRQIIYTNKKNTQLLAEVAYSNEELKRLNYMVSHDLRTPLRQIVSFSKLAQISNQQGELSSSLEYMGLVEGSAKELYLMTENLLSLAHLNHNQLKTESVILADIFEKMQRQFTKIEGENSITIHTQTQDLILQASPILLQMLLQNLVENGIKYNESHKKEIWLEAKETEQETRIYVKDNGIGIADADRDKIFGVFNRLDHDKYQGTGLGLAIAKKIMDIHGGTITVTKGEHGTDFILCFPGTENNTSADDEEGQTNIPFKVIYQLSKQGRAIF